MSCSDCEEQLLVWCRPILEPLALVLPYSTYEVDNHGSSFPRSHVFWAQLGTSRTSDAGQSKSQAQRYLSSLGHKSLRKRTPACPSPRWRGRGQCEDSTSQKRTWRLLVMVDGRDGHEAFELAGWQAGRLARSGPRRLMANRVFIHRTASTRSDPRSAKLNRSTAQVPNFDDNITLLITCTE